jgi:DNA-binding beta-propeller fold protein YncE
MTKNYSILINLILALFIFSSCQDAEDIKLKTAGVYVYHEGAFGSNNATIGNYDPESLDYNPSLYRGQNSSFIGDVQQNILVDNNNDRIYSVLNGSNSIDLMTSNLKSEGKISFPELDKPRDIAVLDDLAFIANWGPYNENFALTNSEIFIVDLSTNELVDRIETQEYPEHLFIKNNKLIVSHASFDGSISEISIINLDNLQIEETLEVPSGPQEIIEDDNGNVWVVCTSGNLLQLSASLTSIANQIELDDSVLGDIDSYEDAIYFYSDSEISFLNISDKSISSTGIEVEMQTPYAFAIDPVSGDFYLGDALDFSSEGLVIRYDAEGELLDTFESGIAPTQFSFNIERDR